MSNRKGPSFSNGFGAADAGQSNPVTLTITSVPLGGKKYAAYPEPA